MEGGGRSGQESRAEKLMDEYLKSAGFHRKKVAKDGSCLFRAVAEQVLHCQNLHTEVRAACVKFLRQNRDVYEAFIEGDFEKYLLKLQDPQQWVGEVEINALAIMYKRDIQIFQEVGKPAVSITDNNFKEKVRLCFLNGNHYDSVYPISHIKNAALCQSILYELLYDGVFKVDRSLLSVCQRSARQSDLLSDDNMAACQSSDDDDGGPLESRWVENGTSSTSTRLNNNQSFRGRGRGRLLPERVRRSLNPTLLRNIEYDIWIKTKKAQHKMDYCIATGMQFNVGDRCQVRLEGSGRSYSATVKEVPVNNSSVKVFIEELGLRNVPLWLLRPPNDDSVWSKVGNRDKKGGEHGELEERGRGRGRGKGLPSSSSQPTGSERRVQRQTSDDSRKAQPELTFGLTEQQRLFREEEQRNVALVEIQLRDELSFPALGTQLESERGKKGEKKRSQRTKARIPEEDFEAPPLSPPELAPPTPESPPDQVSGRSSLESSASIPPALALATVSGSAPLSSGSAPLSGAPAVSSPLTSTPVSEPTNPGPPSAASPPTSVVLTSALDASSSAPSSEAPPFPSCPAETPSRSQGSPTFSQDSTPPAPPPPALSAPPPALSAPAPPPSLAAPPPALSAPPPALSAPAPPPTLSAPPPSLAGPAPPPSLAGPAPPPALSAPAPPPSLSAPAPPPPLAAPPPSLSAPPPTLSAPPPPLTAPAPPPSLAAPPPSLSAPAPPPSLSAPAPPPSLAAPPPALSAPAPPPSLSAPPLPLAAPPPLQCLPPVYHDPLYPGFPQAPGGGVAPTPSFSRSQSGDDLPTDVSLLRFFFNLGLKAYSLPMYPPYIYLYPLQHTHMLQAQQGPETNPQQLPPVSSPWQQATRPPIFPTPYPHPNLQPPPLPPPTNGSPAPAPAQPPPATAHVAHANNLPPVTSVLGFTPAEQPSSVRGLLSDPAALQPAAPRVPSQLPLGLEPERVSRTMAWPNSRSPASPPYPEVSHALMSAGDVLSYPAAEQRWDPTDGIRSSYRNTGRRNNRRKSNRGWAPLSRRPGEPEPMAFGYTQYSSSFRGRGHDRGY